MVGRFRFSKSTGTRYNRWHVRNQWLRKIKCKNEDVELIIPIKFQETHTDTLPSEFRRSEVNGCPDCAKETSCYEE